jgi:RNA polymerase sigma factor (sigma-70 family)
MPKRLATASNPRAVAAIQGTVRWNGLRSRARPLASEVSLSQQEQPQADEETADVALARGGDRGAFERLYRQHVGRIRGLSLRMAGVEFADDLTQDVFVRAWQKLGSYRGESRFGTWLYRLAVNVILEERRKAGARPRIQDDEHAMQKLSVAAADGVAALDIASAVGQLPEGARQVFVLHDVEGYKHREIGKLVGITAGTSKGQLHRARTILRRYLAGASRTPGRDGFEE